MLASHIKKGAGCFYTSSLLVRFIFTVTFYKHTKRINLTFYRLTGNSLYWHLWHLSPGSLNYTEKVQRVDSLQSSFDTFKWQIWFGQTPDLGFLRISACVCLRGSQIMLKILYVSSGFGVQPKRGWRMLVRIGMSEIPSLLCSLWIQDAFQQMDGCGIAKRH